LFSFLLFIGPGIPTRIERHLPYYAFLETCPLDFRDVIAADIRTIIQDVSLGVSTQRASATDTTWTTWEAFCADLNIDPTLQTTPDPVLPLQLFALRYRRGEISPSKSKVRGKTVGDALRAVGQTLANMGYSDPRLLPSGKLQFRLSRQLAYYSKQDPPPSRVKPIPSGILQHTVTLLRLGNHARAHTMADMLTLGFYFLLRPGEYALTSNPDSSPFTIQDVHLLVGQTRIPHLSCPTEALDRATFVCLEFTTQKNGIRGELIGLGRSGNSAFCPVQAIINRIRHLRTFNARPSTPLYAFFYHAWFAISTANLTAELRNSVATLGAAMGLSPDDISIRSLRSSGAMALLCANVDTDRIRLLGRWRSDEMLRYLHVQAYPVVATLAPAMLRHGNFSLLQNQQLPQPRLPPGTGATRGL
jgi:hypothetical protein